VAKILSQRIPSASVVENGDNGSRDLFVTLLMDGEGHVGSLEAQVHQFHEIGYERYLITLLKVI